MTNIVNFVRGSVLHFKAEQFKDAEGASVTPSGVSLLLDYPTAANINVRATETLPMTLSTGVYLVSWNSNVAGPGRVDWFWKTTGADTIADEGSITLKANAANLRQ